MTNLIQPTGYFEYDRLKMTDYHNMNALNLKLRSAWTGPPAPAQFACTGLDTYPALLALKFH